MNELIISHIYIYINLWIPRPIVAESTNATSSQAMMGLVTLRSSYSQLKKSRYYFKATTTTTTML